MTNLNKQNYYVSAIVFYVENNHARIPHDGILFTTDDITAETLLEWKTQLITDFKEKYDTENKALDIILINWKKID